MNNQPHRQALEAIELSRTENRPVYLPYSHALAVCLADEGTDLYEDMTTFRGPQQANGDSEWIVRLERRLASDVAITGVIGPTRRKRF